MTENYKLYFQKICGYQIFDFMIIFKNFAVSVKILDLDLHTHLGPSHSGPQLFWTYWA